MISNILHYVLSPHMAWLRLPSETKVCCVSRTMITGNIPTRTAWYRLRQI